MDKGLLTWKGLSTDDKKTLQSVYSNYDKLWEFQCKVNQNLMVYLFGENMGEHYWDKFTRELDRNVMKLMRGMDSDKKGDLVANIFFNKNLYAHTSGCSCNNGIIDCPGCKDANEEYLKKGKLNCAGCNGSGKVVCGKCGGN